ncbi:MAG: initiation control protein YabA [Firmicutes bacterium]|nr:initiation control protein YabA [Bacillota bacterium]
MKISAQIDLIVDRINEILHEVEDLKKQLEVLEKRNEQLSNYLQKEDKSQSVGNLIKLYEQGFHICHSSFGRMREEDCIFCLNVIDRTE